MQATAIFMQPVRTINADVLADEWASHSQGGMICRVCYVLPKDGGKDEFFE